jgi:tyrosine-protein phosphatase SIW14
MICFYRLMPDSKKYREVEMVQVSKNLSRGGRPSLNQVLELTKAGFKTIINLQSGFFEFLHDDEYEHMMQEEYGIRFIDIPCSDVMPPTLEQVQSFFNIIKAYGPVYVHCLHGVDRTGFMCAAYRMQIEGWQYKDAKAELFSNGFHKIPYLWWLCELKKYEVK